MNKLIGKIARVILGQHLAMRLRLYTPDNISPENKIVFSWIWGVDDMVDEDENEIPSDLE